MFLTFVSPPNDKDAIVRFSNSVNGNNVKTSLDAEVNSNVQYIRWHFQKGCWMILKSRKSQTRRSATTSYRPWRSRCARVKRQLLGKWPRGPPHLRGLLLFCSCVRAGANLRPNLETTPGEEIPCPDLTGHCLRYSDVRHRS